MPYSVRIESRRVDRQIATVPKEVYPAVQDALRSLKEEPRPHRVIKLRGRNDYRIRVGRYRIIYDIDDAAQEIVITGVVIRDEYSYNH